MVWWAKQDIHSSWRVAVASALFVVGVCASQWVRVGSIFGVVFSVLAIGLFLLAKAYILPLLALCAAGAGMAYGSTHLEGREKYAPYIGKEVILRGRVKEDIGRSSSGSYSIQLDDIILNGTSLPGTVLASSRTVGGALRGDVMEVRAKAKEGFGSFPISLTVSSIVSVERTSFADVGRVIRDRFAEKVRQVIPEPQAGLGIGFLTGQKSSLPMDLADSLKIAGLTHIVVASGYNLTILVRLARKLFLKVSKFLSATASSIMILAFVAVTGMSPSMTRAGLVSGMSLLSWYYGHAFHPFVLLPFAAAITVCIQPSYVWGDMGWQLSFAAFMGVMIVAPLLQVYFFGNKDPGTVRQILGETIAAHIVTVPIIAMSFGTISNVAIIANLLVVPFVPLAMLLTFICGIGVMLGAPFVEWIATPTTWLLGYMTEVARIVSELPWAQSTVTLQPIAWLGYGIIIAIACVWMWRHTRYSFRNSEALI